MSQKDVYTKYKNLERREYFDKNQELAKRVFDEENLPTILDIANFVKSDPESRDISPRLQKMIDFEDNLDDFTTMATRTEHQYSQQESSEFIRKVMSANNKEISDSGYLYKLLCASGDSLVITEEDCESEGQEFNISEDSFSEADFNYYIRSMFSPELNKFVDENFNEFKEAYPNIIKRGTFTVRTPISCSALHHNGICRKCVGIMPTKSKNIGVFTALMVTESATQAALSSMNKGRKINVNDALKIGYKGEVSLDSIIAWISEIVSSIQNKDVSARFYQLALISRIKYQPADTNFEFPHISSLRASIQFSGNLFGSFIFNSSEKTLLKMINEKSFEDNSLKLKIALNKYDEDDKCK